MYATAHIANQKFLATFGNGRLYNGYATSNIKLAPAGFHVPTQAEFATLVTYLGGSTVAGGKIKSIRTGLNPGWESPNTGADNSSYLTALGVGYRNSSGGFSNILRYIDFRTSDSKYYEILYNSNSVSTGSIANAWGMSVRCIMDTPADWYKGMLVYDIDGNAYTTVKIGTQVWMQSNLKTTKLNDGTVIPNITDNAAWAATSDPAQCTYNNAAIVEYQEEIILGA